LDVDLDLMKTRGTGSLPYFLGYVQGNKQMNDVNY